MLQDEVTLFASRKIGKSGVGVSRIEPLSASAVLRKSRTVRIARVWNGVEIEWKGGEIGWNGLGVFGRRIFA